MQLNHVIESEEELLNHFGSSQKLEILDITQMENLLEMNVPPEVWEEASKRNLLFFNQELVQQTQEFIFYARNIEYFHLVQFLANLTQLDLQNNQISDISSISKLKNLKVLYLSCNCIDDISALLSLPDLTHLQLQQTRITSYRLVLPNLVELELAFNNLQHISGLQHSPKLERQNLSSTQTADLHTIPQQLFGLKNLELSQNNIIEISYLSNFVDLQSLNLDFNNQLQNIGPLKFCTQLTQLIISKTSVADIWPLQFLKNLQTLQIAQTQVVDLHPLQYLYKLEKINAHDACIIDVSSLSKLTQLETLYFWNNKITNIETLKHHQNFSQYDFSDQEVPSDVELKFYNKILSVHSSHKQIRKIQIENRASKIQELMTHQREYIKLKINEQNKAINKKIEVWAQYIQNSDADQ
ncbi:leucine-rich_repeat domain-containing protein [Hexamita inflata]|uniref:Leucine-rich repeat domain-containing protein n=1 Tax=Hexamita inflata TaxID=28002 RepID=A0AA86TVI2_9EUKA|nr:leucine-rich repeat domain-containing protein [Hexamita inflata]CAI9933869.1 leucine-rich repeat domain-containing protein [Hexamita inflata]